MNRQLLLMVRGDNTGLGNQTRRLSQLLKPERIMFINSETFSKNKDQHREWYEGFPGYEINGFPTINQIRKSLQGMTHFFCCENPMSLQAYGIARAMGIKTICMVNYEFLDALNQPHLPLPDKFLMPSHWMIEDMKQRFGEDKVQYLPPPIFPEEFTETRKANLERKGKPRFLHVIGTLAQGDRNGTLSLLESLKQTNADFELVIKSQHPLPEDHQVQDTRLYYKIGSEETVADIYTDFDAMIMPRRFGGLCLPMQEALMSALPVIMPAISPNNAILPKEWLVPATITGGMQTRTYIDSYEMHPADLAKKINDFVSRTLTVRDKDSIDAFELAYNNYAPSALREEYDKLWL